MNAGNAENMDVTMFKIASATMAYALGIGVAFGTTIAAVVAVLQ